MRENQLLELSCSAYCCYTYFLHMKITNRLRENTLLSPQ